MSLRIKIAHLCNNQVLGLEDFFVCVNKKAICLSGKCESRDAFECYEAGGVHE